MKPVHERLATLLGHPLDRRVGYPDPTLSMDTTGLPVAVSCRILFYRLHRPDIALLSIFASGNRLVPVEHDPPGPLQELIAVCTTETFTYLCDPAKADWLVGQIASVLPLPPHAARPLATYALKLLAQAVDAQATAGAGWLARKAGRLAVVVLQNLPYSDAICAAVAKLLSRLNGDAQARDAAERAIAARGHEVDPALAGRLSLDLRAGLRQLQDMAELRDRFAELREGFDSIEDAILAGHQDLKDYLSDALNPQPPLHLPIVKDDEQARFVFRAQRVPFFGRATELAALRGFLDHPDPFRWWLMTGPAGTGKSRLALEFCLRAPRQWRMGFLHGDTDYDRFEHWQPFQHTLLVIDYAAREPKKVGRWLRQLAIRDGDRALAAPVRVLLLERAKLESWWRDLTSEDTHSLRQRFHGGAADEMPLALADAAADRAEIAWHTVESLFRAAGRPVPDQAATMAAIADIDAQTRPLFAAFATNAILGGRNIRGWDRRRLIEDVIERSRERLWRPTAERLGVDLARHELLLRLATVAQGLPLSALDTPPPTLRLPHRDPEHDHGHSMALYHTMVAGGVVVGGGAMAFAPLEPDILGEVFVLMPPERLRLDPESHAHQLSALAAMAWSTGDALGVASFLDHAAADFFADRALSALLQVQPDGPAQALARAMLAFNILTRADTPAQIAETASFLDELRRLADRWYDQPEIAQTLARGLFNRGDRLVGAGQLDAAGACLDELRRLSDRWHDQPEIALRLARGLVNRGYDLAGAGQLEAAGACLDELRALAGCWPDQPEIVRQLAMGLVNHGNDLAGAGQLAEAGRLAAEAIHVMSAACTCMSPSVPDAVIVAWSGLARPLAGLLVPLDDDRNLARLVDAVDRMGTASGRPRLLRVGLGWAVLGHMIVLDETDRSGDAVDLARQHRPSLVDEEFHRSVMEASPGLAAFLDRTIGAAGDAPGGPS